VMVAAGDKRGPRGRAQRGGVEGVVAQTVGGQSLEARGRNRAAKGRACPKANVIGYDQQDIRCAFRRLHMSRELWFRLPRRATAGQSLLCSCTRRRCRKEWPAENRSERRFRAGQKELPSIHGPLQG